MLNNIPLFELKNLKYFFKKNISQEIKSINQKNFIYGFLSYSSWSLALIIYWRSKINSSKKIIKILIPKYFCNNALKFINKFENIIFVYYDTDSNFIINYKNIMQKINENDIDIFLHVNYFNLGTTVDNRIINLCRNKNIWSIADNTHSFTIKNNLDQFSDFFLFSPYKHLCIPNGAILIINKNNNTLKDLESFNFHNPKNWLLNCLLIARKYNIQLNSYKLTFFKWIIKRALNYIKVYSTKDAIESESTSKNYKYESPKISFFSKQLIFNSYSKYYLIEEKRRINFYYLINIVSLIINNNKLNCEIIYKNLELLPTPYLLQVSGSYEQLIKLSLKLKKNKISSFFWPDLLNNVNMNFSDVIELKNSLLFINYNHTILNKVFINLYHNNISSNNSITDYNRPDINQIESSEYYKIFMKLKKNNFVNSPMFLKIKKQIDHVTIKYYKAVYNDCIYLFSVIEKKFFFIKIFKINRSPVSNFSDNIHQIINTFLSNSIFKGFSFLFFYPEIESNFNNSKIFLENKIYNYPNTYSNQLILSLNNTAEFIKNNFKQKWRNSLNKSLKSNIEISIHKEKKYLDELINNYNINKKNKNFRGINSLYLKMIHQNINSSEYYLIMNAHKDNQIIGQICIMLHGLSATYLIGNNSNKGRTYNVNYLLLWKAIIELKKLKIEYFDLGGFDYNNDNISNFKLGINAKILKTFGLSFKYR